MTNWMVLITLWVFIFRKSALRWDLMSPLKKGSCSSLHSAQLCVQVHPHCLSIYWFNVWMCVCVSLNMTVFYWADNEWATCIGWFQFDAVWLRRHAAAVCVHKHNAHRPLGLFPQPNQSGCLPVSNSLYDWLSVSYNFDPRYVPMRELK